MSILSTLKAFYVKHYTFHDNQWETAGEPTELPDDFHVPYPECPKCDRELSGKFGRLGVECECGWSSGSGSL